MWESIILAIGLATSLIFTVLISWLIWVWLIIIESGWTLPPMTRRDITWRDVLIGHILTTIFLGIAAFSMGLSLAL